MSMLMGLAVSKAAADSAFISVPLQRTGADANASGLVTIRLTGTNSSLLLQVTNLAPGRTFAIVSGGMVRGTLVPDRNGRAQVRFTQPDTTTTLPFDFDPRGRAFVILQEKRAVLRAMISGPGEPRGSIVNEEATLLRLPLAGGSANARYELQANGRRRFSVTLTNVNDGTWRMHIDGIRRGNIVVSGRAGTITFDNDGTTAGPALNFDPRGAVIDLSRTNILRFSSKFEAKARGINLAVPSEQVFSIPPVAAPLNSAALGRRSVDREARKRFDVELVNVPVGEYELYASGLFLGMIPVLTSAGGELQFFSEPEDEEELRLNFNVATSFYTIQAGGVVFFEGFPELIGVSTNTNSTVRLELPLFNLGADADGIARAKYKRDEFGRRHFEVSLRNVPKGDYAFTVNGLHFATFKVVDTANGPRGLIEFEDEPEFPEYQLDFDPLGQLIGISRGRTRYFERLLPQNP